MDWVVRGAILVAALLAGVVLSRWWRHDPWSTTLLDVGGYAIFLAGLWWAWNLGSEAGLAAAAASLGSLLFTMAHQRRTRPT